MLEKPLKVFRNVTGGTVHGWVSVLLGVFILLLSLGAMAVGLGLFPLDPETAKMPLWIVVVGGLVFALIGVRFVFHGIEGIRKRARSRRIRRGRSVRSRTR